MEGDSLPLGIFLYEFANEGLISASGKRVRKSEEE
jgi:hypothetical protein